MRKEILTTKKVLLFWLPLAATWLMMSVEGPYVSAMIARLSEPKLNLAAFGVAFSLAVFIEAPIIMIMTASTTLVEDFKTYTKLRNFTVFLNAIITVLMLILVIDPVFRFVTVTLMNLPENLYDLCKLGTILFIPWPAAIGFRRFYQGVLIRYGHTRKVAYGTILRLVSMSVTAFLLYRYGDVDGIALGAASLSIGVTAEAIATRIMAGKAIRLYVGIREDKNPKINYSYIFSFYVPLLATSIIAMGARPLVTFFMARAVAPVESLAVLPVITALVFIFRSGGIAYQEVVIALLNENKENREPVLKFAVILGTVSTIALIVLSLTPLADWWLADVSGLSRELTEFAKMPLLILSLMPALAVLVNVQRGLLVYKHRTRPITVGSAVEMLGIIAVSLIMIGIFDVVGAIGAAMGFFLGRVMVNIYYAYELRRKNKSKIMTN